MPQAGKQWFMMFDVGDWKQDPELSLCKPATRGIWMDALCAMHQLDQDGSISGSVDDLARLCRCWPAEMRGAIADLKLRNAADIKGDVTLHDEKVRVGNGIVTLTCRRMQRDAADRKSARERKKRYDERRRAGGNGESNGEGAPHIKNHNHIHTPPKPPKGGTRERRSRVIVRLPEDRK